MDNERFWRNSNRAMRDSVHLTRIQASPNMSRFVRKFLVVPTRWVRRTKRVATWVRRVGARERVARETGRATASIAKWKRRVPFQDSQDTVPHSLPMPGIVRCLQLSPQKTSRIIQGGEGPTFRLSPSFHRIKLLGAPTSTLPGGWHIVCCLLVGPP